MGIIKLRSAYRRGDDGGSLGAAFNLALLLHRQGDRDGAMAAWQRADDRRDAEAAYYVAEYATRYEDKLGALIRASTRGEERAPARLASFFSASELTDGTENSAQALEAGAELWASGDLKAAQAAFRRLDEGRSADGADALGCVLGGGDLAGTGMEHHAEAMAAFRRADERGSALGALHLGQRLLIRGEQIAEARATIVRAGSRDTAGMLPSGFGPCSPRSISARAHGRRDSGPRRFIAVRTFAAVHDTRVSTPVRRIGVTAVFRRGPVTSCGRPNRYRSVLTVIAPPLRHPDNVRRRLGGCAIAAGTRSGSRSTPRDARQNREYHRASCRMEDGVGSRARDSTMEHPANRL